MRSRIFGAVLAGLLALAPGSAGAARWIEGVVSHVRDGDTIVIGELVLRLLGLHAPELRHAGGEVARRWMVENVLGQKLVCRLDGKRSHGRLVAVCFNANGDLAAQLIDAGLGRDCPCFSAGRYAGLETEAGRRLALPAYCLPRPTRRVAAAPDAATITAGSPASRPSPRRDAAIAAGAPAPPASQPSARPDGARIAEAR